MDSKKVWFMMRDIFVYFCIMAPIIIWFGMLFGDYLEGEYVPPWKKKKNNVNSGAKFG